MTSLVINLSIIHFITPKTDKTDKLPIISCTYFSDAVSGIVIA